MFLRTTKFILLKAPLHIPAKKSPVLLLSSIALLVGIPLSLSASPEQEHFEKKIRPLLVGKCVDCHGPTRQEGGLRLDSRAHLNVGGVSGRALQASDSDNSLIIQVLSDEVHAKLRITKEELHDLRLWIQVGAYDPRSEMADWKNLPNAERAKDHWSFKAIKNPPVPSMADEVSSIIDRFVLAAQSEAGLKPV